MGYEGGMPIVTFGEALLRFSPPGFRTLEQATSMDVEVAGAEYAVAFSAARLGAPARWVSVLPDNPLSDLVLNQARSQGVDVSHVAKTAHGRLGLFFLEAGATPRPSRVIYDREGSAMSRRPAGMIAWDAALKGARYFHVSGITPALSPACAEETLRALHAARSAGLTVSYDFNYRGSLWSLEQARETQRPFMDLVDILTCGAELLGKLLGIEAADERALAKAAVKRFGFKTVILTRRRETTAWKNSWSALMLHAGAYTESADYEVDVVDRIGGGDSFVGAFLAQLSRGGSPEGALRFATAYAALKHSMPGNLCWATQRDVEHVLSGHDMRVQR
jgi:2-dehydro-3-deoxygluconokinase